MASPEEDPEAAHKAAREKFLQRAKEEEEKQLAEKRRLFAQRRQAPALHERGPEPESQQVIIERKHEQNAKIDTLEMISGGARGGNFVRDEFKQQALIDRLDQDNLTKNKRKMALQQQEEEAGFKAEREAKAQTNAAKNAAVVAAAEAKVRAAEAERAAKRARFKVVGAPQGSSAAPAAPAELGINTESASVPAVQDPTQASSLEVSTSATVSVAPPRTAAGSSASGINLLGGYDSESDSESDDAVEKLEDPVETAPAARSKPASSPPPASPATAPLEPSFTTKAVVPQPTQQQDIRSSPLDDLLDAGAELQRQLASFTS